MEEKTKVEQVSWNLGEAIIMEIAGLLKVASGHYVKREYGCTFDNLKAVKLRICADLDEDESKDFIKMEDAMFLLKAEAKDGRGWIVESKQLIASFKLWKKLDEYNLLLMEALKKYGYHVPRKVDNTEIRA